ncbi:MAG: cell wall metabolism sensor histidine kinase WalK [Oscillospiraceae bacterium]|nr:cell wall metabolism sensor histidine kinase WalK [Oscillospiraceae bacterium]
MFKFLKKRKLNNGANDIIKDAVEQMSSEKNKVEMILQNLTDGVIAFDSLQNVIHMNNTAAEMLKIPNENPGVMFDELFEKLGVNICMAEFLYLERERTVERQIKIDDKLIGAKFVSFKMGSEKTAGVIAVFRDITEQIALENTRREFVANASHELNTPLATIKAYTETLQDGALDDRTTAMEFLSIMENEADRMTRIVKDLLDISSYDSRRVVWNRTYFSPDKLLKSIETKFSIETKNNDQTLTYSTTTELPSRIYADRDKMEQVITNLISNAMKYTKGGGTIEIFAGKIYGELYIKVRDNGIGIPAADLPHIFDRFYRVDKDRSRERGGTGLGLAIAKEIITNHGGNIKIDSEYGRFTEVLITLPTTN